MQNCLLISQEKSVQSIVILQARIHALIIYYKKLRTFLQCLTGKPRTFIGMHPNEPKIDVLILPCIRISLVL